MWGFRRKLIGQANRQWYKKNLLQAKTDLHPLKGMLVTFLLAFQTVSNR